MKRSAEEQDLTKQFAEQYQRAQAPVMQELERSVCGCDYGGTSWTTREEADLIKRLIELGDGKKLLEVGSGSGWPALYLAASSRCDVTLVDVPLPAVRIASERATIEPPPGTASFAVGDGAALPFADEQFDAVSHSDVLCCLSPKLRVLAECRRVIRGNGAMVFSVIFVAPGLPESVHQRAVDCGPPYIDSDSSYPKMLADTGWRIADERDITPAYEDTGRRHLREVQAREGALRGLLGDDGFEELLEKRKKNVAAVAERLVRRSLFKVRPAADRRTRGESRC